MRYYSLQVLRIVYMAMVVVLHIKAYLFIYGHSTGTFINALPNAFFAAAFPFFSISGFVMAFLIDIGYHHFLPRRLMRIYPTFWVACGLTILANYFIQGVAPTKGMLPTLTLLPVGPEEPILRVEWTLVYEISYYFIIAPFATRRLGPHYLKFLLLWAGAIFVAYYVFWMRSAYVAPNILTVYLSNYSLYFITGGLAYHLQKRTKTRHWSWYAAGLLVCCAAAVISSWNRPFIPLKAMHEVALWSLCTAGTLYCAVKLEGTCRCRWLEALSNFGEYSYAYYLIHAVIIMSLFNVLVYRLGLPLGDGAVWLALALVGILGYGFGRLDLALHRYFKQKLR